MPMPAPKPNRINAFWQSILPSWSGYLAAQAGRVPTLAAAQSWREFLPGITSPVHALIDGWFMALNGLEWSEQWMMVGVGKKRNNKNQYYSG